MKKVKVFKSESGRDFMLDWYQKFKKALSFPVREEIVKTKFGETDILHTGPEDGIPVLLLHGAMAGAPYALGELHDIPERWRMIAVNIMGQSPVAEQVRLDFKSPEYADWLTEILDYLGLDKVVVAGVSWGGSVALRFAKHCPERVQGMVLMVPGSIVKGSSWKEFINVGFPMLRYQLFRTEANRDKAFSKILTTHDPMWTPYLADAFQHYKIDFNVPPLLKPSDFATLEAPVFIVAADKDPFFPGEMLLKRAEVLFPNLVGTHLLENCHHSPSFAPEARAAFGQILERALQMVT